MLRATVSLATIAILKSSLGVTAVMLGYLAGETARLCLLLARALRRATVRLDRSVVALTPEVRDFFRTGSFQLAGTLSIGFVPLIDKTMASWMGSGSVSLIEYGDRLYMIPATLLGAGIVVTSLSQWSSTLHAHGARALYLEVKGVLRRVAWVASALALVFIVLSAPIVGIVYGRLPAHDAALVRAILIAYTFGLAPYVLGQLCNRALLTIRDTRFLFLVTLVANTFNIGFNLLLMHFFGLVGIAVSSAVTAMLVFLVLLARVRARLDAGSKPLHEGDAGRVAYRA
jgi:putative peptidoglycan lipid II flippase